MLQPFNTVFHVMVIPPPGIKVILFLLHSCNFATVMDCNINIYYARYLLHDLCERVGQPDPQVENHHLSSSLPLAIHVFWFPGLANNKILNKEFL